ncbi:MAG: hypothetical protein AAGF29_06940 [Pseudomonadota bacterium]
MLSSDFARQNQRRIERTIRSFGQENGYAERFYQSKAQNSGGKKLLIQSVVTIVALAAFVFSFINGVLQETLIAGGGVALIAAVLWGWRTMAALRKQDQLYRNAVDRKNGIDRRFGRLGADRKNQNA